MKKEISICWLRRDLRLADNAALYHALKGSNPVLLLFIFDKTILEKLSTKNDARVTFIYQTIEALRKEAAKYGSSVLVLNDTPERAWQKVLKTYNVKNVFANHDYEPYARERDDALAEFLASESIPFKTFKDQVIFEKDEIFKADGKPYTVFTPYFRQWEKKLTSFYKKSYPVSSYLKNLFQTKPFPSLSLNELGFEKSDQDFPSIHFAKKLDEYEKRRDYPGDEATSRIGLHLRFGTVSIREAVREAIEQKADKWLSELVWRDFYMMILWHFPYVSKSCFKPAYDKIEWRNDEQEFKAWCEGKTGYPLVDAGMRQLNEIGFMHNRVRMVVASFLTKHLLIDWRWGETYFAEKLLDYEMASNVGGWQWACGCGNDAAPYFRVFNPELQAKRFDPKHTYIDKWLPEFKQQKHVEPIVEHAFARERVLKVFKDALNQ
ncbi:cryptochrome/photolyase family protein [Pedobacter sp. JCM 36344]|uniref:cryptochrome/photolyase family protein n=1 Tax=Pedobacter sp. JCM 36344 TaxID=3374280 RepID=UPI00397AC0F9